MLDPWYLRGGQGAEVKICSVLDPLSRALGVTKVFGESPYMRLITSSPIFPSYIDGTQNGFTLGQLCL